MLKKKHGLHPAPQDFTCRGVLGIPCFRIKLLELAGNAADVAGAVV